MFGICACAFGGCVCVRMRCGELTDSEIGRRYQNIFPDISMHIHIRSELPYIYSLASKYKAG